MNIKNSLQQKIPKPKSNPIIINTTSTGKKVIQKKSGGGCGCWGSKKKLS
ncbi:hypothetical protein P4646_02060 [Peribacillus simplex]|nr:hypothetical protein [Peribacillus simplex]MED3982876.1 hypothetical protein [Peribacillus simplex]MED4095581.1 hypothetical protein [Peribacillus simplex]